MPRHKEFDPDIALDRAMRTFWARGYAGTTPQRLADELGIGKGSLYNAFGGKRDIFLAALRRYAEGAAVEFATLLDAPGTARERIRRLLSAVVEPDGDPRAGRDGCLAVNTATELAGDDPEAARIVEAMFARTEGELRAVLERARRDGELASDRDVAALAALLAATLSGLRVRMRAGADPAVLRPAIEAALAAI